MSITIQFYTLQHLKKKTRKFSWKKCVDSEFVKTCHEHVKAQLNKDNCFMSSILYLLVKKNLCTALNRILYEKWVGKDLQPHQDNRHTLLFLLGLRLVCRAAVPVIKRTLYLQKLLPMGHHWVVVQRQVQASHLHLVTASIWKGGSVPKKRMAVSQPNPGNWIIREKNFLSNWLVLQAAYYILTEKFFAKIISVMSNAKFPILKSR